LKKLGNLNLPKNQESDISTLITSSNHSIR